jgi:hypothetical protein
VEDGNVSASLRGVEQRELASRLLVPWQGIWPARGARKVLSGQCQDGVNSSWMYAEKVPSTCKKSFLLQLNHP